MKGCFARTPSRKCNRCRWCECVPRAPGIALYSYMASQISQGHVGKPRKTRDRNSQIWKFQVFGILESWESAPGLQLAVPELCVLVADGMLVRTHSVAHAHATASCPTWRARSRTMPKHSRNTFWENLIFEKIESEIYFLGSKKCPPPHPHSDLPLRSPSHSDVCYLQRDGSLTSLPPAELVGLSQHSTIRIAWSHDSPGTSMMIEVLCIGAYNFGRAHDFVLKKLTLF